MNVFGIVSYSDIFGKKLLELARRDERVLAISAAMEDGTGLSEFAQAGYFPLRLVPRLVAHQGGVHPLRVAKLLLPLLFLAELVLNDAQLFPQVVFLLLLVDDGAHAVLDVVLQLLFLRSGGLNFFSINFSQDGNYT